MGTVKYIVLYKVKDTCITCITFTGMAGECQFAQCREIRYIVFR